VKDRLLLGALRGAYQGLLARDRHPVVALFLEVPGEEVDVNVHPAKTEVRFRDPAGVRGLIVSAIRAALDGAGSVRVAPAPPVAMWQRESPTPAAPALRETSMRFAAPPPMARAEMAEPIAGTTDFPLGVARGQVAATYVIAEAADGLVIVDQHAAHERLVLEGMRTGADGVASQRLLGGEVVEMEEVACDRVEAAAADLAALGWRSSGSGRARCWCGAFRPCWGRRTSPRWCGTWRTIWPRMTRRPAWPTGSNMSRPRWRATVRCARGGCCRWPR
jgi:DNA mismatch repair protein MutL